MSSFRPGRGHDSRKSVFYTNEEWELLDPSPKDLEESTAQEERKKQLPEGNKGTDVALVCHYPRRHLPTASGAGGPSGAGSSHAGEFAFSLREIKHKGLKKITLQEMSNCPVLWFLNFFRR